MSVPRGLAQQGQTVRLHATFKFAGSLFDPFEIRQVVIYAADGVTEVATFSGAEIVRESLGLYYVDWPIPADEPTTIHFDHWFATATSGGTEEEFGDNHFLVLAFSSSSPDTAWVTVAEVRAAIPSDSALTDVEIANQIDLAQTIIRECTGNNFLPTSKTVVFDGTGRERLPLGEPILSVSRAAVIGCGGTESEIPVEEIVLSKSRTMLSLGHGARRSERALGTDGWPGGPGTVGSVFGCRIWPAGFANIAITGDWGRYTSVPASIKAALILLIRYATFCDDPNGVPSEAFKSESIPGDRAYTLAEVYANAKVNNLTGYPDVDRILTRRWAEPSVGFA